MPRRVVIDCLQYNWHKEVTQWLNRVYRKSHHLSQLELANEVGVARQTINLIENNKYNPTLELWLKLARALQTDLNTLFWEEH